MSLLNRDLKGLRANVFVRLWRKYVRHTNRTLLAMMNPRQPGPWNLPRRL